jgi:thiol:disulfide interchange protein DsbD
MTVSYFTSTGGSRGQSIGKALIYGLSIVAIYTGVGVVLSLVLGADAANVISSHWLPNVVSFVIFVLFGLSFLGLFEIQAPTGLVNKVDRQADKGGWSGLFFMAATLVLVSFSCTVPFVGSVAIASAGGELLRPTLGMLSFALAFALPFVLFALFPSWLKSMPRSGGWLNTLKVMMGFVPVGLYSAAPRRRKHPRECAPFVARRGIVHVHALLGAGHVWCPAAGIVGAAAAALAPRLFTDGTRYRRGSTHCLR